jgi:putative heme-binding domain-containing protein
MLVTLERAGGSWEKLQANRDQPSVGALVQKAQELFRRANVLAGDENAAADARLAAAALLCRSREHRAAGVAVLATFLKPQRTIDIQSEAVAALAQSKADAVPSLLAQAWPELSVTMRERVLDAWMSRRAWTEDLLGRLQAKEVVPASIDLAHRERLTRHPDKSVAERAAKVFNSAGDPSRAKVIEEYRSAIALPGDMARGKQVYLRSCIACHRYNQEGRDIGPNLATVTGHAPEKLLVNILDPNADIQPGYQLYTCVLVSGETLSGLLVSETANSLGIKQADGSIRTVTRREVDMLYNSSRSLMPEGLEKQLQPQDVADLIRFLRTPAP